MCGRVTYPGSVHALDRGATMQSFSFSNGINEYRQARNPASVLGMSKAEKILSELLRGYPACSRAFWSRKSGHPTSSSKRPVNESPNLTLIGGCAAKSRRSKRVRGSSPFLEVLADPRITQVELSVFFHVNQRVAWVAICATAVSIFSPLFRCTGEREHVVFNQRCIKAWRSSGTEVPSWRREADPTKGIPCSPTFLEDGWELGPTASSP